MSNDNDITVKLQSFHQAASPQSKRNTKNLSLQLKPMTSVSQQQPNSLPIKTPLTAPFSKTSSFPLSPTGVRLYRHPPLSGSPNQQDPNSQSSSISSPSSTSAPIRRRTTLSLTIPQDSDKSSSSKLSSNSIPSFSSSSPITSSPIIPSTPNDSGFNTNLNFSQRSSLSSNSTLQNLPTTAQTNGDLKTQTLIQNLLNIDISDDGDNSKINAYPEGPKLVLNHNLFLYSEPTLAQLSDYDLVINVAKELKPPFKTDQQECLPTTGLTHLLHEHLNYYYVPWTHTSNICPDLPFLTDIIISNLQQGKKVLIHCQCGVSRSASLIVALIMKLKHLNLNDSYNILKDRAADISPNMSLIFQLMEWGDIIGVNAATPSSQYANDHSPVKRFQEEESNVRS